MKEIDTQPQTSPSKVEDIFDAGVGIASAATGSWFVSPSGARNAVAHRILTEKTFAENFQEGRFAHLHASLNPEYVRSSTGPFDFFKKLKNQFGAQRNVASQLKQEGLSFGELWKAESWAQKTSGSSFAGVGVLLGGALAFSGIQGLFKKSAPAVKSCKRRSITEGFYFSGRYDKFSF